MAETEGRGTEMSWLDEMERHDPAYKGAYDTIWCCPANCGTDLIERDGGMYCPACDEPVSWAELQAADTDD
jgi:uncharacterized Zn finger protein (UPF0148 family)